MTHSREAASFRQPPLREQTRLKQPAGVKIEADLLSAEPREHSVQELQGCACRRGHHGPDVGRGAPMSREGVALRSAVVRGHDERLTQTLGHESLEKAR